MGSLEMLEVISESGHVGVKCLYFRMIPSINPSWFISDDGRVVLSIKMSDRLVWRRGIFHATIFKPVWAGYQLDAYRSCALNERLHPAYVDVANSHGFV